MRLIAGILIAILLMALPVEDYGQTRQRARKKTQTTAVKKQPAAKGKTTGQKNSGGAGKSGSGSKGTGSKGPQTSAEAKKQKAAAQKEIQLTQEQIRENDAKVSRGLAELGKLDIEIEKTRGKIKELNGQLGRLDKEISGLESSISKNESELAKLREEYLKAVKKMRVTRKNRNVLAFIFSSKSMSQAMRRMRYLREFSAWRGRQTDEINGKIADLKQEQEALTKAKSEQQTALALQKSSEKQLSTQKGRQEVLVAELKQNGQALDRHLKQKQAEARELDNKVSQLIAEEQRRAAEEARKAAEEQRRQEEAARKEAEEAARRKAEEERLLAEASTQEKGTKKEDSRKETTRKETAKKETAKKETGKKQNNESNKNTYTVGNDKGAYADARRRAPRGNASSTTASSATKSSGKATSPSKETAKAAKESGGTFEGMRGRLPYPSSGSFTITSRFGRQELADLPGVEYDNPGIDAESDPGASARAVFKGKVSGVYLLPGYNTVVIVNHGNYYTVYGNIISPSVKTGDSVDSGTMLGKLAADEDNSGRSTIHFEVWRNREKLNPQDWLK